MRNLKVKDLGLAGYQHALDMQKRTVERVRAGESGDTLILSEHPAVITIGSGGSEGNILEDSGKPLEEKIEVIKACRGGDVTVHSPGQVISYPIFDLRRHGKDLRLFIRNLEEVLGMVVSEYGLEAEDNLEYTGLWIGGRKIGFIGIAVTHWITYHGASLNINNNLEYFLKIVPCGIKGVCVTSLKDLLNKDIDIDSVKKRICEKFCEVFGFGGWTRE